MPNTSGSNKRIARNTVMLYFRMLLIMAVSLYTSRIVLETLGVEDFGIYNVVGGVVAMLGFLNSAMSVATQRFLSYEVGTGDLLQLQRVFSSTVLIHCAIAFFIFVVAETAGLWFLNTCLSIPAERMGAANWVFQFSILTFVVNILSVPYNALIISHEEMGIYAYISIAEAILKLSVIYLLDCFSLDKLKLYALLIFLVSLFIRIIYQFYCTRKYPECKFEFAWQKNLLKNLTSFSGWSLFGGIAQIAKVQGVGIVLNIVWGATINAAWGIAQQVNAAVLLFVQNFVMAINPPIIKAFAQGERDRLFSLLFNGMKYTFFLAFCLIVPLLFETGFVLSLWLKSVPEHTVAIVRYVLVAIMVELFSHTIATTVQATGNIRWYQIVVGGILFLNLPLSYVAVKMTGSPVSPMQVAVLLAGISMIFRFLILYRLVHFPLSRLLLLFCLVVILCLLSCLSAYALHCVLGQGMLRFVLITLSVFAVSAFVLAVWGTSKEERARIRLFISHKLRPNDAR